MSFFTTPPTLTKTLDPADYVLLEPQLRIVDRFPIGHEQHPHRRWEYAMAVFAIEYWQTKMPFPDLPFQRHPFPFALDIGGAGSSLRDVLKSMGVQSYVVDPKETLPLEDLVYKAPGELPTKAPIVLCISTLEHIPDGNYFDFLRALVDSVWLGGLLFLTVDITDDLSGQDKAHFHWMRERIFTPATWCFLVSHLMSQGFDLLGVADWGYHGAQVYDYSFASIALRKRLI